jgi:anti-sigma28 factor (negative regulator of flagellin synthesis)
LPSKSVESHSQGSYRKQQSDGGSLAQMHDVHMDISKTQLQTFQVDEKIVAETRQNEEKLKQLKQFIHMVDLFNVMESDAKNQISSSPEGDL